MEGDDFNFWIHLYKAKSLLLNNNTKLCKKELKGALEIFQKENQGDSVVTKAMNVMGLYLKVSPLPTPLPPRGGGKRCQLVDFGRRRRNVCQSYVLCVCVWELELYNK